MENKTITIGADDMAKLITVQIVGAMAIMAHTQLKPHEIRDLKEAIKIDIHNGTYKQAGNVYNVIATERPAHDFN